ncbi:Hydrogenase-4 component B [bacterium HR09]|nr:Hydrogenase-4 component B [bacterium HR09]
MSEVLLVLLGIVLGGTVMVAFPNRRLGLALFELAALFGLAASIRHWVEGETLTLRWPWGLPFASLSLTLDPLACFFLVLLFLLSAFAAWYGYGYTQHQHETQKRQIWACFTGLVVAMGLVMLAANGVLFLLGWELMSLSAFFLVRSAGSERSQAASWSFLVASHVSGAALVGFFFVVGQEASSLDFALLASQTLPETTKNLAFFLALLGFGLKAGLVPGHFWLPQAHPEAPSHGSALLSGLMIKLGIYGLLRTLPWLSTPALWWAWVLLTLGGFSAFFAILQAHGQDDWKRALAYSSVENMGLASLGLGLWVWGTAADQGEIAAMALFAVLIHLLSHALAKGSFFLLAGCLDHATGTRNPDLLGGLGRPLGTTATAAMLAATAMSGLPPSLAFFSEFLLLYAGVQAVLSGGTLSGTWVVGSVALTAGVAAFAFAKLYAATFLGEPRSEKSRSPHRLPPTMEAPTLLLALLAVILGLASPLLLKAFSPIVQAAVSVSVEGVSASLFRLFSTLVLAAGTFMLVGIVATGALFLGLRRRAALTTTWGCGYLAPSPRMQYTSTASSQPLLRFLQPLVPADPPRPSRTLFPTARTLALSYRDPVVQTLSTLRQTAWQLMPRIPLGKPGKVSLYVLFVALTLVALLFLEVFLW